MKKQIKKSKSLNNKKTHKKTGGIAGVDIRGKVAQGLKLDKDALKLKDQGIVKGTKKMIGYEKIDVKEINQLYLRINQFNIEYNIGLQTEDNKHGTKYFDNQIDLSDKTKEMMKDYKLEEEVDNELVSKLLFRDSSKQRLFKEYKITYYEPEESVNLDELKETKKYLSAPFQDEIDTNVGIYQHYIGKNLTYNFKTMRLPFIINKVYQEIKADKTKTMIEYRVPLKWALKKYLKINDYGVAQPEPDANNDESSYREALTKLFTCFDTEGSHRPDNYIYNMGDNTLVTNEKECPKVSEIDDFLPLLAIKEKESDIWVTIKEPANLALIGVKSRSNLHDKQANPIVKYGITYNNLLRDPISKDPVDFDARKIFNKKAEYYDGSDNYKKGKIKLSTTKNFGFGLHGYVSPDKTLKVDFYKLNNKKKQIADVNEENRIAKNEANKQEKQEKQTKNSD